MLKPLTQARAATVIPILISLLLLLSSCALAQSPAARAGTGGAGPYEVSGTYTHVLTDGSFGTPLGMNGWAASLAAKVFPAVQFTGEAGGYRKTGVQIYSFLAGPQVKVHVWRVQPFARALFGLSRASGSNEFSAAAGGGIDVPVATHISIRALQCDYYRFLGGQFGKTDMLRAGFGITYSFGD